MGDAGGPMGAKVMIILGMRALKMKPFEQEQSDQRCPNLDAEGVFAGALVRTKDVTVRFCFRDLKNSSIFQRSLKMAAMVVAPNSTGWRAVRSCVDWFHPRRRFGGAGRDIPFWLAERRVE